MGTFFASRRNQLIVAGVAVALLLVILVLLALRGPAQKIGVISAATSPGPSASPSPSPDATPSATAAPTSISTPIPALTAAPTRAPTAAPAYGELVTTAGHELNAAPAGSADRLGSGAPCWQTWMDSGWTIDHTSDGADCGIFAIRNSDQGGSVAFVVEHRGTSPVQRRVYLMTGTDAWHVRLAALDDDGSRYTAISVKQARISGDAFPEVVVGFRINGTGKFLTYDIVEMNADGALTVAASRNLDHGSANISGSELVDYTPYPNANTPDYFIRSVLAFRAGAFHIIDSSHAPERGPGDLAPPP